MQAGQGGGAGEGEREREVATPRFEEPVWLVRAVLGLLLLGLAAYVGRQAYLFWGSL